MMDGEHLAWHRELCVEAVIDIYCDVMPEPPANMVAGPAMGGRRKGAMGLG